ncbi:sulfotransferase [Mycobacterium sp. 1081908.1]|uniref:sulfotransferase n=1 Tax=Mycobacterium sp. 1081908.1 TaxID=1834066 RepID=UPI000B192182|nr:sulfotransferase [Mycobacterium sp. 1081908.1]
MAVEREFANPVEGRQRILVTGAPRSGTTWAGRMIAHAPGMGYIHEPFTPENGDLCGFANPIKVKFQYITDENACQFDNYLEGLVDFKYPVWTNLVHTRTAREAARVLLAFANLSTHRLRKDTAVMKDPVAVFSAPWLARRFDMNVVVMIRHPAALCSSLKILNWKFDFNHFLRQPRLMRETRLADFESEIRYFAAHEQEIILVGALLWNCIYAVVNEYRTRYPGWLFLKHEELSMDPVDSFQKVYAALGLEFTTGARTAIEASSGEQNPSEPVRGDEFSIRRNSRVNVLNWKSRLSDREITTIKELTGDISRLFYSDLEW